MALLACYAVMLKQSGCARHDAQSKCHARCAPWVLLPHDNGPFVRFQVSLEVGRSGILKLQGCECARLQGVKVEGLFF